MRKIVCLAALLLIPGLLSAKDSTVSSVKGTASIVSKSDTAAARVGITVKSGQKIVTKARSRLKVSLSDGSKIEIFPNSQVEVQTTRKQQQSFLVKLGKIKAWVSHNVRRTKFEVRTPIAVCSVRGTEFTVEVDDKGASEIDVFKGLVGVRKADDTGEEIPVGAGEMLRVGEAPLSPSEKNEFIPEESQIRREVGLEMSKEEVQAAAAGEMRLAEYQEGKTLIDAFGSRVRLEEYIMRPAADTFKLVVLNERDNRFDYFYYQGTFNKELPDDLSVALRDLGGTLGSTAPEYYLTEYERSFSNTLDYVKDTGEGGHLIKITYNNDGTFTLEDPADPANTRTISAYDADAGAYDPIADVFDTGRSSALDLALYNPANDSFDPFAAGQTLWMSRFNSYEHVINGIRKQWYLPSDNAKNILASDLDGHWLYPASDSQGNTVFGEWGVAGAESGYPDGEQFHNRLRIDYYDSTYEQYDTYVISDEGKVASFADLGGITSGADYKAALLNWNYEQVITATEFGGRKIDLVVEPRIFIRSGLIK